MSQIALFHSPKDQAVLKLLPNFTPRPTLWLSEIIEYLEVSRAMGNGLSRQTLIEMLESGDLVGVLIGTGNKKRWLVDQKSFELYLQSVHAQLSAGMKEAA